MQPADLFLLFSISLALRALPLNNEGEFFLFAYSLLY